MTGKRRAEPTPRVGQRIPAVPPGAGESDPRAKKVPNRRPGPRHYAPDPPTSVKPTSSAPKPRARKATPAAPTSSAPRSAPPAPRTPTRSRHDDAAAVAHQYAARQAMRATGGRPSVTGRAVSGGAAGVAAGATLGSIVPGVGTAAGAAVGGTVGTVGGAVSGAKAKKAYKAAMRTSPGAHKALVAEFGVCITIVALSPLTDRRKDDTPGHFMKRLTAVLGLFFVLGLVSAGGRSMARVASAFGGLIAVVLAVSERDLFTKLATVFTSTEDAPAGGTGPSGDFIPTPDPIRKRPEGAMS